MQRSPLLLAMPLALVLFTACGRDAPDEPSESPAAPAVNSDVYIVRGEVAALPASGDTTYGFQVRHEAIDDFRAADGTVLGMDAMTMQFPVYDPRLLEGVAVGDKVELTYEVNWHGEPIQRVSALRKLPSDTVLEFRKAEPPGPPPGPPGSPGVRP
jgi:Cu/Ag efflux protein CusF